MTWKRAKILGGLVLLGFVLAALVSFLVLWTRDRDLQRRLDTYTPLILRHARTSNVSPALVRAVIRYESAGRPEAVSNKNARGLMQITPVTEVELLRRLRVPVGSLFDPDYNIRLGTAYLRILLDRFDDDPWLALAAYNCGPTRIQYLLEDHPGLDGRELVVRFAPAVTASYCRHVLDFAATPWPPASQSGVPP